MGLGLAHKILDTFEKMDAINPTFELIEEKGLRNEARKGTFG